MAKKKEKQLEKEVRKPLKFPGSCQYSLCVPSTIIRDSNARNLEQITHIAYQVAKVATIFNVLEIIILDIPTDTTKNHENISEVRDSRSNTKRIKFDDDKHNLSNTRKEIQSPSPDENESAKENKGVLFATLLQYFVTPPYLVKTTFADEKYKKKLKYAKSLPKISTLPFMSNNEVFKNFREGITLSSTLLRSHSHNRQKSLPETNFVNVGRKRAFELDQKVPTNVRVTVDLRNRKIVSPTSAYGVVGAKLSFGYYVRFCNRFSSLFTQSPFPEGYTSSVYVNSDDYFNANDSIPERCSIASKLPQHIEQENGKILLIIGNYLDFERSFQSDRDNLPSVTSVAQFFDSELSIPKGTRIEDAALITMSILKSTSH